MSFEITDPIVFHATSARTGVDMGCLNRRVCGRSQYLSCSNLLER
jgi:hypothetical protein